MGRNEILIFLLDDDLLFQKSLEHQLLHALKRNVRIKCFSIGEDCLDHIHENPQIVILDYLLNSKVPDAMNGTEVLCRIKEKVPEIQVIMLSAHDRIEVAVETIKYGAYDYIIKNESAFLKTQNSVRNVINSLNLGRKVKKYSFWMKFVLVSIVGILGALILLEWAYKGVIK
jgi:two-component system OmpR family response regulator